MDHTAYSGHQRQQEVSSCEILCGDQGGGQDPDKLCYSNLAGTGESPMSKQGTKIKRQVASVSKKAKEPSDQSNNNLLSGPAHPPKVKYTILTPQHPRKVKYSETVTVKQQQDERPTLKQHSQGRKRCRGKPVHRELDGQLASQPVESHSFQVDTKEATSLGGRQSVPSHQITTPSQSEIKSTSNNHYCSSISRTSTSSQSEVLGFLPKRLYYEPQENQETYYINSEGHL